MELKHTVELINSRCYKDRFVAEYLQTKIRYEKLKAFNNKIEAAEITRFTGRPAHMPKHDCPDELLRRQQAIMGEYLHILELRAVIEGIDLKEIVSFGRDILSEIIKEDQMKENNNALIEQLKKNHK